MIKKKIEGMSNKALLLAKSKTKLYRFISEDENVRGALLHGTHLIKEMRLNHNLGILETLVLGHAYLGISLMTSNIKENGRLAFKINCEGPVKGLSVESNSYGEVRGFLKVNPIAVDKPLENFDLSPFFGEGFLEVTSFPEYAKQPYVGHVKLKYKNIASDLANYYMESEQTPTYFNLSVQFSKDGEITGAGGLLLQALPDATDKTLAKIEGAAENFPSIGDQFSKGKTAEEMINDHLKGLSPKILSNKRVEFYCPCSKKSILKMLNNMDQKTRENIAENGPFPLEIKCHNCNTTYQFSREALNHKD